ncbi:6-pyruvoyl tetrahydrobiopterin synthase [Prauserella sp. PE36]|uniref:6-carboxy-5,6,7,8-tetrahydropterin synthase n=1 Tax=Amycolatopsis marina TaxID=490629 RepID=A0A1I1BGC4_9PSEU|nr:MULTISPECIES: 6-carboxytetrahydropterin synthase [Pseudonocardiaceae]RBM18646.1 6-pyruvoyl tetrahydrobiopterin synthase [Prauserella sp. PE36]SFB49415.1 6-pyruvoyltetrahydropterin/6-carboxytetrahydropterin synthase [Amycolatopsis marina]
MHGSATTDHATAYLANLVTDDHAPTAHQITIEHTFETAHRLPHLGGKCTSLHGHSWRVAVPVIAPTLSDDVTVVEFGALKAGVRQWIDTYLDHGTMLGIHDPLAVHLAVAKCKVFRFGADRYTTVEDAELLAADLAWPTVEAVAVLLRRVSQAVLATLPCAPDARVGRVFVRETHLNAATYGPVDAL